MKQLLKELHKQAIMNKVFKKFQKGQQKYSKKRINLSFAL